MRSVPIPIAVNVLWVVVALANYGRITSKLLRSVDRDNGIGHRPRLKQLGCLLSWPLGHKAWDEQIVRTDVGNERQRTCQACGVSYTFPLRFIGD